MINESKKTKKAGKTAGNESKKGKPGNGGNREVLENFFNSGTAEKYFFNSAGNIFLTVPPEIFLTVPADKRGSVASYTIGV